ncbi:MAG: hypothetical protein ABI867_12370 [Kofleriaceae bacterium]
MFKLAMLVSAVALLGGCPLFEAEVEVGEVCMTYEDVQIDPSVAVGNTTGASFVFDDLSPIHDLLDLDANLELVRANIRPRSGIASLDFVHSAQVTLASGDPESTLPTLSVLACDGDCFAGGTLEVPASTQQDAVEYVRSESVVIGVDLQGEIPQAAFSVDVDVCMRGTIKYDYSLGD